MQTVHSLLLNFYHWVTPLLQRCYQYPLLSGVILSIFSSFYLIADYGVVNRSSLSFLWQLQQPNAIAQDAFGWLILAISQLFDIGVIASGHLLMVVCHAVLTGLLLAMGKQLFFAKVTRWALIFLLLSHPSYNDFRAYIIVDPLFWCCWLLAVYLLVTYYKRRTVMAIGLWLIIFLLATNLTVAAWFWLLIFPFGTLFFKPWRRKSVAYALLGYAGIVIILLFLPVHQGEQPIQWLISTILNNPNSLADVLELKQSNWVKEENSLMAGAFVFSGALSLVIIRSIMIFGVVCTGLAVYALLKRQDKIAEPERLRILSYAMVFGVFISVILFILEKDSASLVSFSVLLLLFLLAALGLSYVFKKVVTGRYSRLSVLVIVWCLVAYFASGFIIFGPRKDYINKAGTAAQKLIDLPIYSNDRLFLFYAGEDPKRPSGWEDIQPAVGDYNFYYAYSKNRNRELPETLKSATPISEYANQRGDKLLIYRFVRD